MTVVYENNETNRWNAVELQEQKLRDGDEDLTVEATGISVQNHDNAQPIKTGGGCPFRFVPLTMGGRGRTHMVSEGSASLIGDFHPNEQEDAVTLDDLTKMTNLFYEKAFQDKTIDKFIRSHDDPHGERFAKWIHQKLSGSNVWDQERAQRDTTPVKLAGGYRHVVHDRSSAHAAAWYSPKRPANEVGRHFQLDECRVWMRLHFWALRESGVLDKSPSFADYYCRFIGHFVNVYESSAPPFTRDSFRWSADARNIEAYLKNGREMTDVLNLSLEEAEGQIPADEANDFVWPYNQTPSGDVSR